MVLLDWSILGIGLIYGLGWALVISLTLAGYNGMWAPWLLYSKQYYIVANLLAFILAFCIVIGWYASSRLARIARGISSRNLSFGDGRAHVYAWVVLIVSLALRWLYVREFGGFFAYLDYSAAVRSGVSGVHNRFSFLQPFAMMAPFSSFLFLASIINNKRGVLKSIGFAVSIAFSIYVLYSLLGRIGFLIYLSTFILAFFHIKRTRPGILLVGGILGGAGILASAYLVSGWLGIKGANSLSEYVSRELSFVFVSFFAQLDSGEHLFRWYRDFLFSPLYLLPSSWWMQWIEDVSQINTQVVMGARKGEMGVTGGIPVDLLTLGLMQSSIAGVAIVGVLFGAMIRTLQGFVDGVPSQGLRSVLWAYFSIRVAAYAIAYAHPVHLITGIFGVIFSIFLIFVLSIMSKIRIGSVR